MQERGWPQNKVIIRSNGMQTTIESLEKEMSQIPLDQITVNVSEVEDKFGPELRSLQNHIQNLTPFECDNLEILQAAFFKCFFTRWDRKILDSLVKTIHDWNKFIKPLRGSWNCPVFSVKDKYGDEERTYYKVLRKTNNIVTKLSYQYEFHREFVPINEWIQAEVSSSAGLYGLKKKEEGGTGGRFHLLLDYSQAYVYLSKRTDTNWFTKEVAEIVPVRARKFQTIDLIYVPPTTFVWGIDSEEMFVKYESVTT